MRWPWTKPDPAPQIPPYQPPIEVHPQPKEQGMLVEEVDTSAMTSTGVHKAWKRLTGKE